MTRTRKIWIAVATLALGLCWFAGANANHALLAGKPSAVAVIDVTKAFDALAEKDAIEADLKSQGEKLKVEEQAKRKHILALQGDLEVLAKDSPAWRRKNEELQTAAIELRVWQTFENGKLNRERGLQIERLYRKLSDAVARHGKDNGYHVVLFKEKPVDFRNAKPEQIPTLIQVRKVLWHSDELDITDAVIQSMNNEYKNSR